MKSDISKAVVVFDLDGLLVDSQELGRQAVNVALRSLGETTEVTPDIWYEQFILQGGSSGLTSRAYVARLLGTEDLAPFRIARDAAWVELLRTQTLPIYPDALEFSKWCRTNCRAIGIATNNDLSLLQLILEKTEYGRLFGNNYVSAKALGIQKPDPRVLSETLLTMNIPDPDSLIVVGDTLPDHELAENFSALSKYPVRSIIRPDPYLKNFKAASETPVRGNLVCNSLFEAMDNESRILSLFASRGIER